MACRLSDLSFDIAASAGWYSAIAGLLAGFALLVILLPLDHSSDEADESKTADAVVVFTCAFFSLLILSFSYAVLSGRIGDGTERGVAASEQLLFGGALGLSSLLLLFGLHSVLGAYGANRQVFRPAQRVILAMIAILGPAVVLALQFSSALDLERYRLGADGTTPESCGAWGVPDGVWIDLGITLVALTGIVVLALGRDRLPSIRSAPTLVATGTLGYTVVIAVWTSIVVPFLPGSATTAAGFEHFALVVIGIATLAVAAASWTNR